MAGSCEYGLNFRVPKDNFLCGFAIISFSLNGYSTLNMCYSSKSSLSNRGRIRTKTSTMRKSCHGSGGESPTPFPRRPVFNTRPVRVRFVLGNVEMEQVFLRVFRFSPAISILIMLHNHSSIIYAQSLNSAAGNVVK